MDSVYSKRVKAGKRRTYFFDVRETRGSDFYLTITESRRRQDSDGYDRTKIFLYKEDFNKFVKGLAEAVDHVKTELMPDFDFDAFSHDDDYESDGAQPKDPEFEMSSGKLDSPKTIQDDKVENDSQTITLTQPDVSTDVNHEEVDKW